MPTLLPGKNGAFRRQYQVVGMPEMAALIKAITNVRLKKVPLAMEASGDVSQSLGLLWSLRSEGPHSAYVGSQHAASEC